MTHIYFTNMKSVINWNEVDSDKKSENSEHQQKNVTRAQGRKCLRYTNGEAHRMSYKETHLRTDG